MAGLLDDRRWGITAALAGGLAVLAAAPAMASEPRLDALASERGIEAGALRIAEVESVVVGTATRAASEGLAGERHDLSLHGIPLRGAFESLWRSAAGDRVIAARYPVAPPQLRPEQRRLELEDARAELALLLDAGVGAGVGARVVAGVESAAGRGRLDALRGELVYRMILERPVLAWEFTLPLRMVDGQPTRERVWISAATGRVLEVNNLVDAANQSEVYEINPKHTPEPIEVTLTNIDPDPEPWAEGVVLDGRYLTGSRVRVFNCLDQEAGPYAPWYEEGECFPTQSIAADAEGNYFVPLPDVATAADNRNPTDAYAELSMYFHAERFFARMAELGVEEFPCEVSNMVANFHWLEPAPGFPELDYGPFNNAFYSGACNIEDGPTMLFGQGSAVDFAYDGDVVYHELGHGIVQQLTPEGLRGWRLREDGVLRDARAINETIADYHSLILTDRPELAEYVGFYWPEIDRAWIRNADNDRMCPRDMAGQEHNDSEPVTAALWNARRRIGGDKLDPVVLASLPLLARDASIEEFSAALLEIAAAEREAGSWTGEDVEQLERTLAGRNLLDCPRVVEDPSELDPDHFIFLRADSRVVTPFWPGPVQYRHVVAEDSDNLLISFEVSGRGNSAGQPVDNSVEPRVLVKRSGVSDDAPIRFRYELTSVGYQDEDEQDIDEITQVSGDWDEIYTPTVLSETRRQVLIRDLAPGEVVHVDFVTVADETTVIRRPFFASVPSEELDEGSPSADGDGADEGSGCACASEPDGGSPGVLALGLLLLAAVRRPRPDRRE